MQLKAVVIDHLDHLQALQIWPVCTLGVCKIRLYGQDTAKVIEG